MADTPTAPRKQRTRQHVIADQSVNHVERFVIDEGHTVIRVVTDYGYDLVMNTFDASGYTEPGVVFFQLKASDSFVLRGGNYSYDLDVRDYNLWKAEREPVYLILFDAANRRAYWLHVQEHFATAGRQPRKGAKTVRVAIPRRQVLTRKAVARMRATKNGLFLKSAEEM